MPVVSGSLLVVTNAAANVAEVLVRSTRPRPGGGGAIIDDVVAVATPGGRFSATLVEGPAVIVITPDGAAPRTIPILVAASPNVQTLEAVVRAAEIASGGTRDALDDLAATVGAQLSQVQAEADRAKGYADAINPTQFSKVGHSHAVADVTGLQAALNARAAKSHSHAVADVTGLQAALDGKADAATFKPNTVTVETEKAAKELTGLRKGDVVIVTETGNIYKEV